MLDEELCEICQGTGECVSCDGTGLEDGKIDGEGCPDCDGSGTCMECVGSGLRD